MSSMQPVLAPKVKHNYAPVILAVLLVLAIVGIGYLVATTGSTVSRDARNPLAVNPELKAVQLYAGGSTAVNDQFLAANPELITMQRYEAMRAAAADSRFLAQNPELTAVQRYAAIAAARAEHDFLAQNPEVRLHLAYVNR